MATLNSRSDFFPNRQQVGAFQEQHNLRVDRATRGNRIRRHRRNLDRRKLRRQRREPQETTSTAAGLARVTAYLCQLFR